MTIRQTAHRLYHSNCLLSTVNSFLKRKPRQTYATIQFPTAIFVCKSVDPRNEKEEGGPAWFTEMPSNIYVCALCCWLNAKVSWIKADWIISVQYLKNKNDFFTYVSRQQRVCRQQIDIFIPVPAPKLPITAFDYCSYTPERKKGQNSWNTFSCYQWACSFGGPFTQSSAKGVCDSYELNL